MCAQVRLDEFAIVLLAGIIFIAILMIVWTTPLEMPPEVQPTSLRLLIPPGGSKSFELNISGNLTNVTLKALGEIANWVYFGKNNFNVIAYTTVPVSISVPLDANLGIYTGKIIVSSTGGKKEVSVTVEVQRIILPLNSRSLLFGVPDFSITYAAGSKTLDREENVKIEKGYFSERSLSLIGSLSERELSLVKGAYLKVLIEETNYAGNLIISFNGEEIFNRVVSAGEIELPIDISLLQKTNVITITAGLPGWRFWMSSVYKIKYAEFSVILEGALGKTFTFTLEPAEVNNFNHFLLSYYTPKPIPEIMITINNQIVFAGRPPATLFNLNISKDILGNPLFLAKGENTITFTLTKEGTYDIQNLNLVIFYY
jgi:hypothetical protein